jgi:hypothetical protein
MKTVVYLSIIIYLLLFLTYTFFSQKEKHEKEKQDDTKNTNKNENNKILIHIAWFITGFSIFLLALSNIQYPDLHIGEFTVKLLGLYGFLAFIVFLLYGLTTMTTSQSFYIHKLVSSGFTISFYGILLLGGIGLLSNILNNKQTNILDTIPILKNVMRYLKNQWNITTNTSWVILGLEAILLIGYFTLPALIKRLVHHDSHLLVSQETPLYINKKHNIGSYNQLYRSKRFPNYHYTLHTEFYINKSPGSSPSSSLISNKNESYPCKNILSYGKSPIVCYHSEKNTLTITSMIGDGHGDKKEIILLQNYQVPLQTWNKLVIQYDSGIMDIFINNELLSSTKGVMAYMKYDSITVGQENGLDNGSAIRNVQYYNRNLTTMEMSML